MVADSAARYFHAEVDDRSLTPGDTRLSTRSGWTTGLAAGVSEKEEPHPIELSCYFPSESITVKSLPLRVSGVAS